MSMPNDPENSKPAAPQPAPQQPQPQQPQPAPHPAQQPAPSTQYPYPGQQAAAHPYPAAPRGAYSAAEAGSLPPFNVMALITFVGAFVIPVVGIVCGHLTLAEYRKGLPERGREYAKAGLILGYIFTALWVVIAVVWTVFAFTHFGRAGAGIGGGGGYPRFGSGSGSGSGGGFQFPTPGATPGS